MPNLHAFFFNDPENIGDQVCCPVDYFELLRSAKKIEWAAAPESVASAPVIMGGGGLFNPVLTEKLSQVVLHKKAPMIIWGVGTNMHRDPKPFYPEFLHTIEMVGVRDFGSPFEYVPCPSCLHPALDHQYPVRHEFVIYEHAHHTIGIEPSAPRMANNQPKESMDAVVRFLSSGELVITNTYHGCFWAMLLQRRVLIYRPFSNRFCFFKPRVEFCDAENWRSKARETIPAPGYLEECRLLNRSFAERVIELLELA